MLVSGCLFVANIYYADSLPYALQFTRIDAGPASLPNIPAALILLAVLVFGGLLGLAVFVMSIRALAASRSDTDWLELLMIWFSLLAAPVAAIALVAMFVSP